MTGTSHHSWLRWPNTTPSRATCRFRSSQGTRPSTVQVPQSGRRMPLRILMVVLFPAPLGPMKASISPASTEKEMPSTACTSLILGRRIARRLPLMPFSFCLTRKALVRFSDSITFMSSNPPVNFSCKNCENCKTCIKKEPLCHIRFRYMLAAPVLIAA